MEIVCDRMCCRSGYKLRARVPTFERIEFRRRRRARRFFAVGGIGRRVQRKRLHLGRTPDKIVLDHERLSSRLARPDGRGARGVEIKIIR